VKSTKGPSKKSIRQNFKQSLRALKSSQKTGGKRGNPDLPTKTEVDADQASLRWVVL